ncbi:MAG TPA: hypothetical protein VLS25_12580 [Dehalococcoidia bacterium]|nr:hypothetical protein [Dehalococcoidia bacterium]
MTQQKPRPRLKVALTALPDRYIPPSKPSTASPAVQDAYRQTQFLMSEPLLLFERSMNLQLAIVAGNKKARTAPAAALLSFWSRTYSFLGDACTLLSRGSYSSCAPLLRSALDCLAVERGLIRDGFDEYEEWLTAAIYQVKERSALAFELGRYRAGSVLAADERLGPLYRLLTDLSMPHFGSTAFQTGSDSNLQKLSLSFGDSAFHLGWAELVIGWLLELSQAQVVTAVESGLFNVSAEAHAGIENFGRDYQLFRNGGRRCYVEEMDGRFLFHNFRRKPGGVPKRIMF